MQLLLLTCMLAATAAAPNYDQRQDGELNIQADVQNVVLLIVKPERELQNFLDIFSKSGKNEHLSVEDAQDRSSIQLESFVEPSKPYRVEIGKERLAEADGRTVEVVIAGRRRLDTDQEEEPGKDEYKLIGATEQCGPERVRDPVTLTCEFRAGAAPARQKLVPEVVPEVVPGVVPEVVPEVVSSTI